MINRFFMNKTFPPKKTSRRLHLFAGVAAIGLSLAVLQPAYASDLRARMHHPHLRGSSDTIHSIQVNKSLVSKKNKIRLFPDVKQQVLFFSANGDDKRVYQLYLFDMDGRLVSQAS